MDSSGLSVPGCDVAKGNIGICPILILREEFICQISMIFRMTDREVRNMNIGIRLHDTVPGSLADRLSFAHKQGFTCAHLALSKTLDGFSMKDAPNLLTAEMAKQIRETFEQQHMGCVVLGCYLNLADPDSEERRRTQEIYRAHLRFAGEMGAQIVGTETYANPKSSFMPSAAESEGLRPVVRYAEEVNAILAVEPVYYHIISTPERAQRMLEAVPSEHLRIILDAVNLISPALADDPERVVEDAIARLGDRIYMLHMKDYHREGDKMHSMACGLGQMKYEALLRYAKARQLPMTLEDTVPENAEHARLYLESISEKL